MVYNSFFYFLYLATKCALGEIFEQELSTEQIFLEKVTGKKYPQEKAEYLFARISDHKWYVGEKLERDVGFYVAAIDFLENFTDTESDFNKNSGNCDNSKLKFWAGMSSCA